jgi:FKBP-type peptidyl-prolyl cis-trans isomerase
MKTISVLLVSLTLMLGLVACEDEDAVQNATPTAGTVEPTPVPTNIPMPTVSAEATTTASGVQVIVIQEGTGEQAVLLTDTITVHYTGWLEDGTTFDSSVARDEPLQQPLSGLIEGWQEGLVGMKVGEKRRLLIPSELAYGEAGYPPTIPPNANLIFDVELISIP